MAGVAQGYEEERFPTQVNRNLLCQICLLVLKDPVMCRNNEHLFCRCCLQRHLRNSNTCPTCREDLSLETLRPSRLARDTVGSLDIRCDHHDEGCTEIVQVEDLPRHLEQCWFSSVPCSNERCTVVVTRRDQLRHENEECEFRRGHGQSIARIQDELRSLNAKLDDVVKREDLGCLNAKLDELKREDLGCLNAKLDELNIIQLNATMAEMNDAVRIMQTNQTEAKIQIGILSKKVVDIEKRQVSQAAISEEIKRNFTKMMEQIAIINRPTAKTGEYNIVIAGGRGERTTLNSVEHYATSTRSWSALQPMKLKRYAARSIMFNNLMVISGGHNVVTREKSLEYLHLNPVTPSKGWRDLDGELPVPLYVHGAVLHNKRLISLGGLDDKNQAYDRIHEVMLTPPYETNLLGRLPQVVCSHGAVVFGNKIVVCGGTQSMSWKDCVSDVVEFDIGQKKCKMLPPLPFPVCDMAVVKHNNNLVLLGGVDSGGKFLKSVVCYNIELGTSEMLPDMKYARRGCAAVVVGERVVVMGGLDQDGKPLKSVETYMFGGNCWEDLPEMKEARTAATAVGW